MEKNTTTGRMNSNKRKKNKRLLYILLLIIGAVSCDPRNTYVDSLSVVNGTEESIYIFDMFGDQKKSTVLHPDESYELFTVAFDDFTDNSPFEKFINCIKRNGGGVVQLFSLDETSQPENMIVEWMVHDEIIGRHLFNQESLEVKNSNSAMSFDWTFTILPEDLEGGTEP